jgi:hypothetical protein
MRGAIPPLLHTSSWRGALLKHRDNFTNAGYPEAFCISPRLSKQMEGMYRDMKRSQLSSYSFIITASL